MLASGGGLKPERDHRRRWLRAASLRLLRPEPQAAAPRGRAAHISRVIAPADGAQQSEPDPAKLVDLHVMFLAQVGQGAAAVARQNREAEDPELF
jgi:hypothetical protein